MAAFPNEYTHLNSILLSKSLILSTKKHVSMIVQTLKSQI